MEPLQREDSLEGQVQELRQTLQQCTGKPVTLIGFSWGALLSYIVTARYPELVEKLILVGSPPLEEKDSYGIVETRLARLPEDERKLLESSWNQVRDPNCCDKETLLKDTLKLLSKADGYDIVLPDELPSFDCQIFNKVWPEVEKMRSSGELLKLRECIRCPLVVIHGEYDPHPLESLKKAFDGFVEKYKLIPLKKCGHRPWIEHFAKDAFYNAIENELLKK